MKKKQVNKYKYHKTKINIEEIIEKRYKILTIIICIIMIMLLSNLFYIQIIRNEYYKNKLERLTVNIVLGDSAPRGRIYDRNGNLIVDNQAVKTIYYKKQSGQTAKDQLYIAYTLAEYIDVDYSKLTDNMLKEFWILNNKDKANKKITKKEWKKLELRKITNEDIQKLKLSRITEKELSQYTTKDKEACYIYNLMNKGYYYTEKVIKNENVTDYEYAIVAENIDKLNGVNVKMDWNRKYLYNNTFKTMLGSVSTSTTGIPYNLKDYYLNKGYGLTDRVGISYIEYQYEDYLKGEKATYELNENSSYTLLKEGKRGNDVVLTIDIKLQEAVEKIIEEELIRAKGERYTEYFDKSYVVIMEPNTGEILAMAGKQIVNENGKYIIYDYTPGVITASVTPGSIVKGASQIVGYNTGALNIGERRNDACIKIAATPLKCSFKEYGIINDIQALKYSSNTYQFQTAIKVGKAKYEYNKALVIDEDAFNTYRKTFAQFGLGVHTEIDLPNESLGYKGQNKLSGLLLDFSIGQYDTYTPIQIAQYMSTIANGGVRIKPHVLKAVFDSNEKDLTKLIYEQKVEELNKVDTKEKYINRVQEGFKEVLSAGGTGYGYINAKYKPAGKTGTAQSFLDTDRDGMIDTATTTATFAGYAPYDNPEILFTVISPDIAPEEAPYEQTSRINARISQKISEKYFEIYK